MKITKIKHGASGFWDMMGPFFCNRDVHKDLGEAMFSDDHVTWWVASKGGVVAGFCAAIDKGDYIIFSYAYVAPGHRGKGVYKKLWKERDGEHRGRPVRVVVKEDRWKMYEENGFKITRQRGKWIYGERS